MKLTAATLFIVFPTLASTAFAQIAPPPASGNLKVNSLTSATDITADKYIGALDTGTNVALPGVSGAFLNGMNFTESLTLQDMGATAGNRRGQVEFHAGYLGLGFMNDQTGGRVFGITMNGGAADGISGIISNSGSGAWSHTGDLNMTGSHTVLPPGGNGVTVAGTNSSGIPSISAVGATSNVSLDISAKGGSGINLKSPTAITGTLGVSGATSFAGNVTLSPASTFVSEHNNATGGSGSSVQIKATTASGTPFAAFANMTLGANLKWWDIGTQIVGNKFQLRTVDDGNTAAFPWLSATRGSGNTVSAIESNSGSGGWSHTGTFSTSGAATFSSSATFGGNVNVAGNLGSAANTSAPSPTNSGISLGGAPTWAMMQMYDQALTANNRSADLLFISNSIKFRFANDARNAFTDVLSINGGQALGVTGITSTSGSGAWAHTGAFSASGNMTIGGTFKASGGQQLQTFLTAAIPTCSAGSTGLMVAVLDVGDTPSWNATLPAGTGTPAAATTFPVFCDGTNWRIH